MAHDAEACLSLTGLCGAVLLWRQADFPAAQVTAEHKGMSACQLRPYCVRDVSGVRGQVCCRTQGGNALLGSVCLHALFKLSPMLSYYHQCSVLVSGCFVKTDCHLCVDSVMA